MADLQVVTALRREMEELRNQLQQQECTVKAKTSQLLQTEMQVLIMIWICFATYVLHFDIKSLPSQFSPCLISSCMQIMLMIVVQNHIIIR